MDTPKIDNPGNGEVDSGGGRSKLPLILSIVGGVAALVIFSVFGFIYFKKSKNNKNNIQMTSSLENGNHQINISNNNNSVIIPSSLLNENNLPTTDITNISIENINDNNSNGLTNIGIDRYCIVILFYYLYFIIYLIF